MPFSSYLVTSDRFSGTAGVLACQRELSGREWRRLQARTPAVPEERSPLNQVATKGHLKENLML
jgi:hypothetical protein